MSRRRRSSVSLMGGTNPLTNGDMEIQDDKPALKIESIAGCKIISKDDFDEIMDVMNSLEENPARISYINIQKQPYLFSSQYLWDMVHITESVKTRIAFIESLAPRLTDPNSKSDQFIELMRFGEDKSKVELALKTRSDALKAEKLSSAGRAGGSALGGGRGGRGGRGSGGRGGGGRGGGGAGRGAATGEGNAAAAAPAAPKKTLGGAAGGGLSLKEGGIAKPKPKISLGGGAATVASTPEPAPAPVSEPVAKPEQSPAVVVPVPKPRPTPVPVPDPIDLLHEEKRIKSARLGLPEKEEEHHAKPVAEMDEAERKARSEINVVMAALGIRKSESEFAEKAVAMEAWECQAADKREEEAEQVRASARITARVGSARESEGPRPSVGTPDKPAVTQEKSQRRGSFSRRLSAWASGVMGGTSDAALDEAAAVAKPAIDGAPITPQPEKRRSAGRRPSVRDIFSPTRETNSPAGAVTPPPASFAGAQQVVRDDDDDDDDDDDEGGEEDEFDQDPDILPSTGKRMSQGQMRDAVRMSFALGMDRSAFIHLREELSKGEDEENHKLFSYAELLRRRFNKSYGDIEPHELEMHLFDSEFKVKFEMDKAAFKKLPNWKQQNMKKALLLF